MKGIRVGFIIDPIYSLKPHKDTTVLMLEYLQSSNGKNYVATQDQLFIRNNIVYANMQEVKINKDLDIWYELKPAQAIALCELDMVWMRKDPPVDREYVYTTYLLDLVKQQGGKVYNDPKSIRDYNEKLFTLHFPYAPKSIVTTRKKQIQEFATANTKVVIKSLDSFGGRGVFLLNAGDLNTNCLIEMLTNRGTTQVLVQEYIEDINITGDQRVLILNGKPIRESLARMPNPNDLRGNIDAGASYRLIELSDQQYSMCQQLGDAMQQAGIVFAGVDIIGNYCTEINITSPTCVKEINELSGANILGELFMALL